MTIITSQLKYTTHCDPTAELGVSMYAAMFI